MGGTCARACVRMRQAATRNEWREENTWIFFLPPSSGSSAGFGRGGRAPLQALQDAIHASLISVHAGHLHSSGSAIASASTSLGGADVAVATASGGGSGTASRGAGSATARSDARDSSSEMAKANSIVRAVCSKQLDGELWRTSYLEGFSTVGLVGMYVRSGNGRERNVTYGGRSQFHQA